MIIPVRNLGSGGVILDRAPYNLPTNVASGGANIRVVDGDITRLSGTVSVYMSDSPPRHIAPWLLAGGNRYTVAYDERIELHTGLDDVRDISPDGEFVYGGEWDSTQYSQVLLMTNGRGVPLMISPSDDVMQPLPLWPDGYTCRQIRAYRSFLIAIGIQRGSVDHPYLVKWSDAASPDVLSPSWDYTDPTTLAGENPLMGQDGEILTMCELGNSLYIYCEYSVYRMHFIDKPYVFSFETVFGDDGVSSQHGVACYPGGHLVVGRHDIYVHNGNSKRSAGAGRVGLYFRDNCKRPEAVRVFPNHRRSEIWIAFSTTVESPRCDTALIWNYRGDVWTMAALPTDTDGCGLYESFSIAPEFLGPSLSWDKLPDIGWQWDDIQELTWAEMEPSSDNLVPLVTCPDHCKILQGDRGSTWDGIEYQSYVEQSKLDLDDVLGNAVSVKRLSRIYPQITGSGIVRFTVGGSDTPAIVQSWSASGDYSIEADHKVDALATGRYISLRMEMSARGSFSLGGWDLDIRETGSR